jgi:hypothetical protein
MAKAIEKRDKVTAAGSGQGALLVEAIKGAISTGLAPLVTELKAASDRMTQLSDNMDELKGLHLIQAAAARKEEDDDEEDMAAKSEEDDDDEEMAAKAEEEDDEDAAADDDPSDRKKKGDQDDDEDDDEGDDDDLDAMEDLEKQAATEEPGEINKGAKNEGDKTTVTNPPTQGTKFSGNIAEGRLKSSAMKAKGKPFPNLKSNSSINAAAVMVENLQAQVQKLRKSNKRLNNQMLAQSSEFNKEVKKLRNRYSALEAQAEKWADQVDRRSAAVVSPDLRNMLAKVNVDPHEILAGSAEPLSIQAADQMFKILAEGGVQIDPVMRATYKNRMNELGLMESGDMPYSRKN